MANFDLVLDVRHPKGRNVRFWPAGLILRGEVTQGHPPTKNPALAFVGGTIPGLRIQVDTKARKVEIIDRMTLPASRDIDRKLRELCQNEKYRMFAFGRYEDPQEFEVSQKDWPTWLWHLRCLVDHGSLHIVSGKLPERKDIVKMGKVQMGDSCGVTPRDKDKPFWEVNAEEFEEVPVGPRS